MTDGHSDKSGRGLRYGTVGAGVVVALVLIYLLSPGLVLRLAEDGFLDLESRPVQYYLAPMIWLYFNVPLAQRFYDWYMPLFGL